MKKKHLLSLVLVLTLAITCIATLCLSTSAESPSVYLSDLTPTTATAGWSDVHYDEDLSGGSLKLNNAGDPMLFDKGLFAHVDSLIEYDISGLDVLKFTAYIGVNDGSQGYKEQASADFEVKADGVSLYKSEMLKIDSKAVFVDVAIPKGAKTLSLITTQADHTNYADHTVWCDAKLMLDPSSGGLLQKIEASVENGILQVGQTTKIDLTATAYGGQTIANDKLTLKFTTSSDAIATVSADGTITARGEGRATITCEASKGGMSASATITVNCIAKDSTSDFLLSSPSGNIQLLLSNTAEGLRYQVVSNGVTIVEPSKIGFKGSDFSLINGFTYASKTDVKQINETYQNYSGSFAQGHDHCNEQSVTFENGNYTYTVILRAYDDGFAYRSVIGKKDGTNGTLTVTDEVTNFVFPSGTTVWASEVSDMNQTYSYESGFPSIQIENATGKHLMFAALCRYNGIYTLINEADLYGDSFYGSSIDGEGGNALGLTSAPQKSDSVTISLDPTFVSPWRFGIVGDLETITTSDLTENLNPRAEGDFSWVEPGVTAWMWLSEGFQGQRTESTIKRYVDLAADMGWKYLILDEGWQPSSNFSVTGKYYDGYFDYFEDLVDYAADKGVYFIAWVKFRDLDTPEEREILTEWADIGIRGIKADFFESESVERIDGLEAIYEKCAEEHLIVNIHGANKATGERATWPNVINRESLKGQEYGGVWCTDTTIWPYTRAVSGPMDITPHLYPTGGSTTTAAQQLALNVMFESGMPCMASAPNVYYNSPVKSLLKNLPASWDSMEFIDGQIARYTVLARSKGESWYVAGVTNGEQNVSFALDFLDADTKYVATVYADKTRDSFNVYSKEVTSESVLDMHMIQNGGFTVMIRKAEDASLAESIAVDKKNVTLATGTTTKVNFTVAPAAADVCDLVITVSDSSVASVTNDGTVKALKAGVATVTLSSPMSNLSASFEVRVYDKPGQYGVTSYEIKKGETVQIVAGNVIGNDALSDLSYKIGNEWIATVDESGNVTGKEAGVTTLTATNANGENEVITIFVYMDLGMDSSVWSIINPNNDKRPVLSGKTPTTLKMTILTGDVNNTPQNIFVTKAPNGDFEMTVKVSGNLTRDFQSVGLIAFVGNANMVTMERRSHSYLGGNIFCMSTYRNGYQEHYAPESNSTAPAYLKMTKSGNVFTGYYSYDGENWTKLSQTITNETVAGSADLKVGLVARSGSYVAEMEATYENFALNGKIIPFVTDEEICQLLIDPVINVTEGDALNLPEKLIGYKNTGATEEVAVTWYTDGLDLNTPGSYRISAAYGELEVYVTVNVIAKAPVANPDAGITPKEDKITLEEGENGKIEATVIPTFPNDSTDLIFRTNSDCITLSADGTFTAVKAGTATVTITTAAGLTATVTVTVTEKAPVANPDAGITPKEDKITLEEGENGKIEATVIPAFPEDSTDLIFTTDSDCITLNADGTFTAVKAGTATVTITTAAGLSATVTVTVTAADNPPQTGDNAVYATIAVCVASLALVALVLKKRSRI